MAVKLSLLGGLSAEEFLARHWQREPLLVRGAVPDLGEPITPEELAGLACEEGVESRLIREKGGKTPWELRHGPFDEEDFTTLSETHWTLLVQEMNKHVPEFALLQERFSFLPNWRLDDVMVSFAPAFGTVGPHADNYDVFLIQGRGRRRWQINRRAPREDELIPGLPLRIMAHFEPEQEWILEPGDMLYLPPGVTHHGVALEDCITISVGFRAPTLTDMLSAFFAEYLAEQEPDQFFTDPGRPAARNPGEIDLQTRECIRALIRALPLDDEHIDRWFGRYITEVPPGHLLPAPEEEVTDGELLERLEEAGELWRSEYCRYAYVPGRESTLLYVGGEEYPLAPELAFAAPLLAGQRRFTLEELRQPLQNEGFVRLLTELYNDGSVYIPDEE